MKHDAIAAADAAEVPLADLADFLIAHLRTVYDITDMPTSHSEAGRLIAKVRFYGRLQDTGRAMLGRHGIGPAIDMCVDRAARFGFNWRGEDFLGPRPSVVERMLVEADQSNPDAWRA